jgi:hypothetical protein
MDARPVSRYAQERLGWKPKTFPEGLAVTVDWLRDCGEL